MKIHELASSGNCEGVRRELANGVPVDARDDEGFTPLACAAKSPDADESMLTLLIDAGADVNVAMGVSGHTPVGVAAGSGDCLKAQFLLDAGANIRFVSPNGYNALTHAMYSLGVSDELIPVVDFLVKNGVDINCSSAHRESPLSVASLFWQIRRREVLARRRCRSYTARMDGTDDGNRLGEH